MYDRTVKPIPEPPTKGLRYRIETLIGLTGVKMAKYRSSWKESILSPFNVVWRPHLMMILWFEVGVFFIYHNSITQYVRRWSLDSPLASM